MAMTFGAIFLGTFGTQIDPTEGNFTAENASALVNQTFGSSSNPLYKSVFDITSVDHGGNMDEGRAVLDQNNQASNDHLKVDLDRNGSSETYTFDAASAYEATVWFSDGTTRITTLVIAQTTGGQLFLLPSSNASHNEILHSKPISSLKLNAVSSVGGSADVDGATWLGAFADRATGVFRQPDGVVEGSAGSDTIDAAYLADPEGDRIDNSDNTGAAGGAAGGHDDMIRGFAGNDVISAGRGNDTVYAGTGSDHVDGGSGDDLLVGYGNAAGDSSTEAGNDTLLGGSGNDRLLGGAGADSLDGGSGSDTIHGDSGNDILIGGDDADTLLGGTGDDTIYGDDRNGTSSGGAADYIDAGDGDDFANAGAGSDTIVGGLGNDTILGAGGTDYIIGDDQSATDPRGGDDLLLGGDGDDTLIGGFGNDTLDGGADRDTLIGGHGSDTFIVTSGDVIRDFDAAPGQPGADFVDLSSWYNQANLDIWNAAHPGQTYGNALGWLRADQADGVLNSLDGSNGLPTFTLTMRTGGSASDAGTALAGSAFHANNTRVVCFTAGTLIRTATGCVEVQMLSAGDLVRTRDNGLQAVRWIALRRLGSADLLHNPSLRAIRIEAGALGPGTPESDLVVSPQHRMLIRSKIAERMFGEKEVLVAAKQLLGLKGISVAEDLEAVTYVHFMCDAHQIVFANGAETESFYPGQEALKAIPVESREEIFAIFPGLRDAVSEYSAARQLVSGRRGRNLAMRHERANKPMCVALA